MRIIEIIIQVGKLVSHLRGAYQAAKAIHEIVEAAAEIDDMVTDLSVTGLGF